MKESSVLKRNFSDKLMNKESDSGISPSTTETHSTNPILKNILSEGGDDFFEYLKWLGLAKEPNLMILSSMHHYYYDHNDLKGIKTLLNLKRLNQLRHLESFLHTLSRILSVNAYFIGCFKDNARKGLEPSIDQSVKLFSGLMKIFDSKVGRNLSVKSVTSLLEKHSFKVIDITYINGIAYFWAQNKREPL
jgi:hypothetical protein